MTRTPMEIMIDQACGRSLADVEETDEHFNEEAAALLAVVDAACAFVIAVKTDHKRDMMTTRKQLIKAIDELKELGWGD